MTFNLYSVFLHKLNDNGTDIQAKVLCHMDNKLSPYSSIKIDFMILVDEQLILQLYI